MKLMIVLLVSCVSLVLLLFLFLYLCDRFHITVPGQASVQSPFVNPVSSRFLYDQFENNYEQFANILFECLHDIQNRCGLECPSYLGGIFCENISNRVAIQDGKVIFRYEVNRNLSGLCDIGGKRIRNDQVKIEKIGAEIRNALPKYRRVDFWYSWFQISVYDIPGNKVRIEIRDVRLAERIYL